MLRMRWYWRIITLAWLLGIAFVFFHWAFWQYIMWDYLPADVVDKLLLKYMDWIIGPSVRALFSLMGTMVVWGCWMCPFLESGDKRARFRMKPTKRLEFLRVLIWLPPGGLLSGVVVMGVGDVMGEWYEFCRWDWSLASFRLAITLFIAAGCAALFAWFWSRLTSRRFERTRGRAHYCQNCGYNLHGNTTGRCPECGHPINEATSE